MAKVIHCDGCGEILRAESDDELAAIVRTHTHEAHRELVGAYTREDIRRMAARLVSPAVQGAP